MRVASEQELPVLLVLLEVLELQKVLLGWIEVLAVVALEVELEQSPTSGLFH